MRGRTTLLLGDYWRAGLLYTWSRQERTQVAFGESMRLQTLRKSPNGLYQIGFPFLFQQSMTRKGLGNARKQSGTSVGQRRRRLLSITAKGPLPCDLKTRPRFACGPAVAPCKWITRPSLCLFGGPNSAPRYFKPPKTMIPMLMHIFSTLTSSCHLRASSRPLSISTFQSGPPIYPV